MSWNNPTALTGDQAELRNALTPAGAGRGLLTPMRCVILKQEDAVDSLIFFFKLTTLFYLFVFFHDSKGVTAYFRVLSMFIFTFIIA